ncbi:STM4011 family radical SAM protein [Sphingomonas colocasiae]|uniref:STM4011 family radical SAM protein n=1 Tax=Sphingomonas colocasiae TaxID=1848973 RepID=A0ABS7PVG5_9SPHN|nr:STM4011 family radical SAM protein [Sphingomonas colocasiae]MBY8825136.1 STM4011 family radical SAM protein [Sphingomonas colocasiae]
MSAAAPALTIRYRGPLSGCNYDCGYCPFAKTSDSRETLAEDRAALDRFCDWVADRDRPVSILFTPWGEALVRPYYRAAMIRLSRLAHIGTVAIQTNLSRAPDWAAAADTARIAFWITWHPTEAGLSPFLARLAVLDRLGIGYSVGVVAVRAHFDAIARLRAELPPHIYLWINAEESLQGCYTEDEVERLAAIDPLFELNNRAYASAGLACAAGEASISVRGDGTAWRCHFVQVPIGNIYDAGFEQSLFPRPCPRAECNCHIGYGELDALDFPGLFGAGLTERRASFPTRAAAQARLARFDAIPRQGGFPSG